MRSFFRLAEQLRSFSLITSPFYILLKLLHVTGVAMLDVIDFGVGTPRTATNWYHMVVHVAFPPVADPVVAAPPTPDPPCTNITSQKRLEIQALSGATGTLASRRCQHRRHHGILQLRFQLDSDVCSADLHHNPRKHVGLHAHQRLHRLP